MRSSAEVVIVGGGCMGCSLAWHLAERGLTNVVLIEREAQLGAGSTGKNAGGVRHQFSHPANIRLSLESIAMLADFEARVGAPIDFHQDGYLFLVSKSSNVAAFQQNIALQRRMGVDVQWLAPDEASRIAPGIEIGGIRGAAWCAADGIADPNGVTMGFVRAAQLGGRLTVLRETEVTGIEVSSGRIAGVMTSAGPIATRAVVNAAGPWAGQVAAMAGVVLPVVPERRHIFIAQPAPGASWDDAAYAGRTPSTRLMVIDFDTTFYFHREGAGLLFGMGDRSERPGFDTTVKWDFLPDVTETAVRRLPALADASVTHAWAGLYEMTPDHNPVIGGLGVDGFFAIAGFSGHGFQHAPVVGKLLAELIVGGAATTVDITSLGLERFERGDLVREGHVV
jgi:sarcosine oxidase subunit beta